LPNGVCFTLPLGGPPFQLFVLFLHSTTRRRPLVASLYSFRSVQHVPLFFSLGLSNVVCRCFGIPFQHPWWFLFFFLSAHTFTPLNSSLPKPLHVFSGQPHFTPSPPDYGRLNFFLAAPKRTEPPLCPRYYMPHLVVCVEILPLLSPYFGLVCG